MLVDMFNVFILDCKTSSSSTLFRIQYIIIQTIIIEINYTEEEVERPISPDMTSPLNEKQNKSKEF